MTIQLQRPILHHHLLHVLIAGVVILLTTTSSSSYCCCCHGLILQSSFKLPQIRLPWDNNDSSAVVSQKDKSSYSSLRPNDTILIFGGTGGVGQLVTRKLLCRRHTSNINSRELRVAARNPSRAYELLRSSATTIEEEDSYTTTTNIKNNNNSKLEVVQVDLVGKTAATDDELRSIMTGVSAIVITVGTTAFPTSRWFSSNTSSDNKYEIVNTPTAIDNVAVSRIGQIASSISTIQQIVLVTSIGTLRTNSMPFTFLNLFGVLDSKRAGEDAIISSVLSSSNSNSQQRKLSYTIIRPGRLVGGPYTNLDIANLLQISGGISNRVTMTRGDTLIGDCKRTSVAEAVVRCLEMRDDCANIDFSIIDNNDDEENTLPLTDDEWRESFASMKVGEK